jgi:hypothetical protein
MPNLYLKLILKSDATFGRGEGVVGLVDEEVEHDELGFPYLRGRTLKGLLVEEAANLLYALRQQESANYKPFVTAADTLFGKPGTMAEETGILRVGDARLPKPLRDMIRFQKSRHNDNPTRLDVLESLTDIRRQTALDETGRPDEGSLRSMRVVLRQTSFESILHLPRQPKEIELALLGAATLAFQRAGTGRNRGRGALTAQMLDENRNDIPAKTFATFKEEVTQ